MCERCGDFEAVHIHHLTYERAGHELPEDLQHICIGCHCAAHPDKGLEILKWEMERKERILTDGSGAVLETFAEWLELAQFDRECEAEQEREEHNERLGEQKRQEEEEEERQQERPEPAWNLRGYHASGYDLDEIEAEERRGI